MKISNMLYVSRPSNSNAKFETLLENKEILAKS